MNTDKYFTMENFESACDSAIGLALAAKSYYNLIGQIGDSAEALIQSSHDNTFALMQYLLRGFLYQELFKLYDTSKYAGLKFSIPELINMIENTDFEILRDDYAVELLVNVGFDSQIAQRKLNACKDNHEKQLRIAYLLRHRFAEKHKETFNKIERVRNQVIAHPTLSPKIEDFAKYGEMGEFADWCIIIIEGLIKVFYQGAFKLPDGYEAKKQSQALKRLIKKCVQ